VTPNAWMTRLPHMPRTGAASWLMLAAVSSSPALAQAPDWTNAKPGFGWQFPRDHWAHPGYKTEWWYFTGQLTDTSDSTRRFGYQFTFFRVGVSPDSLPINSTWAVTDLVMGHAALTDLSTKTHRFSELVYRANGLLGGFPQPQDSVVAWSRAPAGTDGVWELRWVDQRFAFTAVDDRAGFAFALETRPEKPLVFQGPNGYSRKGNSQTAASLYYSFTRLSTSGTVTIDGKEYTISGESWMDKEFGSNQLTGNQVGWDWFSLRLNDGRDVMVYRLRDRDGATDFARATVVSPEGTPRFQGGDAWDVEVLDTWRSPATGAEYPIRWRIGARDEGISFVVTAELPDQENVSRLVPGLFYWEGSVVVTDESGLFLGVGYVELTGYGTATPPAI